MLFCISKKHYLQRVRPFARVRITEIKGWIVLDQIRAIDKTSLCQKIGELNSGEISEVKNIIKEMLVD